MNRSVSSTPDVDRAITDAARAITDRAPSPAFRARVMADIASRPAPFAWRRWRIASGLAVVLLAAASANLMWRASHEPAATSDVASAVHRADSAAMTSPAAPMAPLAGAATATFDPTAAPRTASPVQMMAMPHDAHAETISTTVAAIDPLTMTPLQGPERLTVDPPGGSVISHSSAIEPLIVAPLTVAAIGDDQQP